MRINAGDPKDQIFLTLKCSRYLVGEFDLANIDSMNKSSFFMLKSSVFYTLTSEKSNRKTKNTGPGKLK